MPTPHPTPKGEGPVGGRGWGAEKNEEWTGERGGEELGEEEGDKCRRKGIDKQLVFNPVNRIDHIKARERKKMRGAGEKRRSGRGGMNHQTSPQNPCMRGQSHHQTTQGVLLWLSMCMHYLGYQCLHHSGTNTGGLFLLVK